MSKVRFLYITLKKSSLFAFIASLLLLLSNSLGFDGYFHAVSVSSLSMIDYFNPGWSISGYIVPRYIGFQYLCLMLTGFGNWGLYPVLVIVHTLILVIIANRVNNYSLKLKLIIAFLYTFNTVFFSALGFGLLLITCGLILSGKKRNQLVLLGGIMHPVAFIFSFALLFSIRSWAYLIILILLLCGISFFLGTAIDQTRFGNRFFEFSEMFDLNSNIFSILAKKYKEIILLFLIVISMYLSFRVNIKKLFWLKNYNLNKINIIYFVLFLSVAVTIKAIPSHYITGGPWSVLSWSLKSQSDLENGKLSFVALAWVSPKIVDSSYSKAQYFFRSTPVNY